MSTLSLLQSGTVAEGVDPTLLAATGDWIVESVGSLSTEPLAVGVLTVGVVGMSIRSVFDSILSDEDGGPDVDEGDDDGLMPEEGGDDLGDLGGGFGDGGDDFGDFEDDDFGEMDGGGADTDELQHRLDELETEVGSLSSTVNTVRNENEQISETVDDVEENVRKLLDIYEMVTRGVNPFADDIDAGGLGGPGEESFGLFDNGDDQSEEGDLDEDIANADAEGFFDEDLVEDDELEADADVGDVLGTGEDNGGDDGGFEEDFEDDFDMDDDFGDAEDDFDMDEDGDGDADSGGEGGKSFAELKDEYEAGDAEWAEGDAEDPDESIEETSDDLAADADSLDDGEPLVDEDDDFAMEDDGGEAGDGLADDDLFDTVIEDEGDEESADEAVDATESATSVVEDDTETEETEPDQETITPEEESVTETAQTEEDATEPAANAEAPSAKEEADGSGATEEASDGSDDGKPYLTSLPDGFLADLIVVEWLEFLVEEVGIRATAEAIDYYERIDWIDESVADQLQAYLKGFEEGGESESLTIDHHTKSLRYVSQLNGGGAESIALQQLPRQTGGGPDGIQR